MFPQAHAVSRGLQYLIAAILALAVVFLLTVLVSTITDASLSAGISGQQSNQAAVKIDSNPNAVASGLGRASGNLLLTADSLARSVRSGLLSGGSAVVRGGAAAGSFVQASLVTAADAAVGAFSWTVRAPGAVLGFASDRSGVTTLIQPKTETQIPIIDPNDAMFRASVSKAGTPPVATDATTIWPMRGNITTLFGVPHWPYQPTHSGLDISSGRASGVTAVHPFRAGTVVAVVPVGINGLGNHVVVDHGNGLSSVYAHLDSIAVVAGQKVSTANLLGREGTTGASTGPHLHLEIRENGYPKDPLAYIGKTP